MSYLILTMAIPNKQLEELGFIEIKKGLFIKALGNGISIYRDYRELHPVTYAYKSGKPIEHKQFKETRAIEAIEKSVGVEATASNSLSSYDNQVMA